MWNYLSHYVNSTYLHNLSPVNQFQCLSSSHSITIPNIFNILYIFFQIFFLENLNPHLRLHMQIPTKIQTIYDNAIDPNINSSCFIFLHFNQFQNDISFHYQCSSFSHYVFMDGNVQLNSGSYVIHYEITLRSLSYPSLYLEQLGYQHVSFAVFLVFYLVIYVFRYPRLEDRVWYQEIIEISTLVSLLVVFLMCFPTFIMTWSCFVIFQDIKLGPLMDMTGWPSEEFHYPLWKLSPLINFFLHASYSILRIS